MQSTISAFIKSQTLMTDAKTLINGTETNQWVLSQYEPKICNQQSVHLLRVKH